MNTIQIRAPHLRGDTAHRNVESAHAQSREISPATAVTIASWWQSPGKVGRQLAAFASGAEVDRTALLGDIGATRHYEGYVDGRMSDEDKLALDMLSTFIIHYEGEQ